MKKMKGKVEQTIKRMSGEERQTFNEMHVDWDCLYNEIYSLLTLRYRFYRLLSPEEMWSEAITVFRRVYNKENIRVFIQSAYNQYLDDYEGISPRDESFSFNEHYNVDTAKEIMWCLSMMFEFCGHPNLNDIQNCILNLIIDWDENESKTKSAIERAKNHADYKYTRDWYVSGTINNKENKTAKENRQDGVQLIPLLEMMQSLWSFFRMSGVSRNDRAEFLSIISGYNKDTIYNQLKSINDKSHYDLSPDRHGEDIERINRLLPSLGVKRPIKIEK